MKAPYEELPQNVADTLLCNQTMYSDAQKKMAQESPHLVWVLPPQKREESKS